MGNIKNIIYNNKNNKKWRNKMLNLLRENKIQENKNDNYNDLLNEIFKVKEEDSIQGNKYNFSLNNFDEKGNIKK